MTLDPKSSAIATSTTAIAMVPVKNGTNAHSHSMLTRKHPDSFQP